MMCIKVIIQNAIDKSIIENSITYKIRVFIYRFIVKKTSISLLVYIFHYSIIIMVMPVFQFR